jgi:hypothetical protein
MLQVITYLIGWVVLFVGITSLYGAARYYTDGRDIIEIGLATTAGIALTFAGGSVILGL